MKQHKVIVNLGIFTYTLSHVFHIFVTFFYFPHKKLNMFCLSFCLQVKVTLADSDQYTFRSCDGCQYSVCLCGEESRTFSWILTPTALGINR